MVDFNKIPRPCRECGRKHNKYRQCDAVAMLPLLEEIVELDLDLETTGRDVELDRPWQIHAGGRTWICDPGREFEPGALEVCGIDDARIEEIRGSRSWANVALEVLEAVTAAGAIVAYNGLTYDGPLLRASLEAVGIDPSGLPPMIDPRVWAVELWPDLANHKLTTVYTSSAVGGFMEGIRAHDAGADCFMMRRVWDATCRERGLSGRTLRAVLAFQERAAELQREDWRRYSGTTPDGAVFLWLRTCRACSGAGSRPALALNGDCEDPFTCLTCRGVGALNHTTKRRGTPIDSRYAWGCLKNIEDLPDAVREKFEEVVR